MPMPYFYYLQILYNLLSPSYQWRPSFSSLLQFWQSLFISALRSTAFRYTYTILF